MALAVALELELELELDLELELTLALTLELTLLADKRISRFGSSPCVVGSNHRHDTYDTLHQSMSTCITTTAIILLTTHLVNVPIFSPVQLVPSWQSDTPERFASLPCPSMQVLQHEPHPRVYVLDRT